jgi:hypothetical protein
MEEAAKSFWRELGQQAIKQFVGALMTEGVKAGLEVFKHERIERQKRRLSKEFEAEDASEGQRAKVWARCPAPTSSAEEARADDPPNDAGDGLPKTPQPPVEPVVFVFDP